MSIITIFQRKFSYSFLALLSLLFIVSISFGTINSSASADGSRKIQEEKSSFINLQNNQAVKNLSETKRFSFLSNNIKNFFNGNDVGQTSAANSIVNGFSYSALSPDSIFTVNNNGDTNDLASGDGVCSDSSGNCTLRAAIQQANATTGTDEIVFNLTTPTTIQLNSTGGLLISEPLTITGPGARLLTVTGNSNTVTGIFKISYAAATTTTISGLTVNGSDGNGINNEARLNLRDVTVKGNRYGIYNTGRLDLNRLTVNNNSSGGIYIGSVSIVNIYNTIITNNTSTEHGGGIHSLSSDVTLNNVTISHNTASTSGGGIYYSGQASGIYVRNTIIANNTAPATTGPDVYSFNSANGAVFTSRGNNLIGKSVAGTGFVHGVNNDKVGTIAAPIDPMLGALQNNGGQTDTRTLLSGSPAKDAGNMCVTNSNCGGVNPPTALLITDQRGTDFPRNYESGVDIGAFESFYPVPSITALSPNNWGTGRGAFELVVTGSDFVAGSIVKWNGQDKVTTFVSNTQLKAQILASDVQTAGQYSITVSNPQPSAGSSEPVSFTVSDCSFSLNPTSQTFTAAGGNGTVSVTTVNGCTWSVLSTAQWITISPIVPPNGKGPGTFSFSVAANTGGARTAEIRVNGLTFNVFQDGGCAYALSSSTFEAPVGGTNGSINITTPSGCPWTAATDSSWITITGGAGGTGNGTITFTVAANTGQARSGTITAGGQTFTINQAAGCAFSLSPTSANPPSGGGTSTFNINAGAGCQWTASSNEPWITITSGSSGSGNGTVTYSVAANTGASRTGTITAGGQTFTVTQAPGCTYSISSVSANSTASGLAGSVNVTASTGCAWTAVSNASWITVTSGASGSGNGTVQFTVAANTGQARTGTITIAGQTFTINQDGGCVFTLSPTGANPPSGGGTSSFNVNAGVGCQWTAQSNDPWITITNGSNGSGNGTVTYSVAANTGGARTGTITAAGQTFTVNQAPGCTYSLSSVSANAPASGLTGSVNVTANTACVWSAASNVSWITITSGSSGNGNGTVAFTVAANTGPERIGTITIAGQTFTVTQANGCVYTLSPTSANPPSGGGTSTFNINAGAGCQWTAQSNTPWITITGGGSGSGNGTVTYSVAANTGGARTGTIIAGEQIFTVNQAPGCTYSLSSTSVNSQASGLTGSVNITANTGCSWTAASNVSWITITSGTNGSGNGTVAFTVAANTGPARPGTITIAGQTFTVNQESGCVYTLSSISANVPSGSSTNSFNISSGVGCAWSAASTASWITVTSGASGSGNGTIQFTVAANTGLERTGTITIAGQTFTVNQANGCTFIISPLNQSFSAAAGSGSFAITASNSACAWTAASNASWITVNTTSGTGNGTVAFTFAANTGLARTGTITAGGQTFTVNQATGCTITLTPTSVSFDAVMSSGSFNVTTSNTACTWTATATQPWITINNGTGTGNGIVTFTVQANVSPARTGGITVGDQTFTINQSNGCVYTLSPTSANVPSGSSTNSFNISSGAGCQWNVVSNSSWITITSGSSGTGSGVINYTAAANIGPARSGTITAGGQTFTVTQASGCVFTLSSTSANSPSNGLTGSVNVTAIDGCAWTVASNVSWITIISGANGNGNGTVAFTVAANTGPARPGTITIAGQTFTVNQANGCVYNLATTSININESGGVGNFEVNSGAGCPWTAVSNEPWITITSGASGSGVGTVEFSVQSNLGGVDRTGTITAANGQTFTVRQVSLTVRNFNDSGLGSLRQAVLNANNSPGNDVITFQLPSPGIIKLTSGEITITDNGTLEIRGPGNDIVHISGENNSRILYVNRATVTISGVTLTKGNGVGAVSENNYKYGGAVYVSQGALVLNRVHLSRNIISVPNAPESRSFGGGVYYLGGADHQIKNSTFSENRCMYGGGYSSQGNVAIENSTFSLNTAEKAGGGIYSVGDTVLRNVTITGNTSDGTNTSGAGIISEAGRLNPANTIISGNNGPDITFTAGQFFSGGNNLIGDSPGDSTNTDKPLAYQPSDILDTPPMLSPLGLYGGSLPTEALLVNSPAINSGNNTNAPAIQTDQRGAPRVMSGVIDIGAFEHNIGISPSGPGLPNGTIGGYYSQELKASRIDGTDPLEPFKYFVANGFLPGGLQLSQEGHLYGYPTTAGVYTFIVKAIATTANDMAGLNKYTIAIGCTYSINPATRSVNSAGENGTVNLTTLTGCTWTAQSNVPWITVTNNPTSPRVGSGAVTYTVQPNTGISRTGTITIGGQTFTVTQANGCAYSLSSNSVNAPAAGGTGSFNINSGTDCPSTTVSNASWITVSGGNTGTGNTVVNFSMQANTGAARTGTITAGGQTYTINQAPGNVTNPRPALFDFDGDKKTDISIFRPSVGEWWYLKSSSGSNGAFQFGSSTDKIVPADYTGDGKTDIAFWRPSTGVWFVLRSEDNSFYSFPFGATGDVPAPADYDGDGKSDAAVFRPSNLTWYILRSSGGVMIQEFGVAGDVPTVADYDGDNKADIAIYRPQAGQWWLLRSSLGIIAYQFGASADKPVQGDYTGDGKTDVAFFRPSSGEWFILRSENESFYSFPFGASGDVPSPGDYDGDGKTDAAVFRPSNQTWFAQRSTSGTLIQGFGIAGDVSVPNAFVP